MLDLFLPDFVMFLTLVRQPYKTLISLKIIAMKKIILFVAFSASLSLVSGQKSIDALFEKFAGKEGFTTITISGDLLKLVASLGNDEDDNSLPASITEIRILSQDNKNLKAGNFYDMVFNDIDLGKYEEFMRIKESDQDVRMLVRSEGRRFREFLLIAKGEDNALIQIKGDLTYRDAKKLSDDAKNNHGINIMADYK